MGGVCGGLMSMACGGVDGGVVLVSRAAVAGVGAVGGRRKVKVTGCVSGGRRPSPSVRGGWSAVLSCRVIGAETGFRGSMTAAGRSTRGPRLLWRTPLGSVTCGAGRCGIGDGRCAGGDITGSAWGSVILGSLGFGVGSNGRIRLGMLSATISGCCPRLRSVIGSASGET